MKGKTVIVTGANTGIGEVTARELAAMGAKVYLACRSKEKAEPVVADIRSLTGNAEVHFLALDLSSLHSVRDAAKTFLALDLPLDLLVNNAGLAAAKGLTADGFELTFGVNHLGHFLFTQLLVDRVVDGGRIVNVASKAHYEAKSIDWDAQRQPTTGLTGLKEYGVSKLANVLFTKELAKRLADRNITTYSLHPGVVASDVWRQVPWPFESLIKRFMLTVEDGALTTLYCATSVEAGKETGLYYDESKVKKPSRLARDEALATELWKRSEAWVA
ncbi:MAG: SDR family NAD(P)-dependent oxidoreductase [Rhodobacterales bacterium]|nr:SDR family NAD(P)-dependent oxidoreductase [Rhodobacterales bacterium]